MSGGLQYWDPDTGDPAKGAGGTTPGGGSGGGGGGSTAPFGAGGYGGGSSNANGFGLTPVSRRVDNGIQYPMGTSQLGGTAFTKPMASPASSGWGGSQGNPFTGASSNPFAGGGWGGMSGGMGGGFPGGSGGFPSSTPAPASGPSDPSNTYSHNGQQGNFLGGGYGYGQWGVNPNGGMNFNGFGDTSNNMQAAIYRLLGQYGQGGAFSPGGNSDLMNAVQHQALLNGDALRQSAYNSANLAGGDPSQQAFAAIQGNLNSQGGVANSLGQAQLGQLQNQQQLAQSLLGTMLNYNNGYESGNNDYQHSQLLMNQQMNGQGGGLGGVLGQVGGSLLGSALGPLGSSLGSGISGLFGGGGGVSESSKTGG